MRKKVFNEKLHNMYCLPKNIREIRSSRIRWMRHRACMEEIRNAQKILVGKLDGKKPDGRLSYRWEDNIKTGLKIGCELNSVS
jgi:hypothetical protein